MKKFIITFIVLILVLTIPFSFVACGEDNVDALKQTIEDLKSQIADLQEQIKNTDSQTIEDLKSQIADLKEQIKNTDSQTIEDLKSQIAELKKQLTNSNGQIADLQDSIQQLETRVEKLETSYALISTLEERISALEDGGMDTSQYEELKTNVENLQKALTDNSTSDSEIKSQVTGMQLVLDKIYGAQGTDGVLTEIQNSLNTLYGEVNRVVQFENGKEYEVKLNGVVYYTVSVLVEYHDGIVQSEQDIIDCTIRDLHWCASVTVTNKMFDSISSSNFGSMMRYIFNDNAIYHSAMYSKEGIMLPDGEQSVSHNNTKRWYFEIFPRDNIIPNNVKLSFSLNFNYGMRVLILDNVWDGIQAPIQGQK